MTGPDVATVPLNFATKAEAVHAELRRRILSGAAEPSAPLNQDALAAELGVSSTPIREAIRRLEAEGLVQFQAHKSAVVAPLTRDEVAEIYEVRLQLDPYAAARAATLCNEDDLREIATLAKPNRSGDALAQLEVNRAFHRAIYSRCGNAALTDILDRLWEQTDRYRMILLRHDLGLRAASLEHAAIVEAMRTRRPREVEKIVHGHIANAERLISDALES